MPDGPFSRSTLFALASAPALLSIAYLTYKSHSIRCSSTSIHGVREGNQADDKPTKFPQKPCSLPKDVDSDDSSWVLAYERVVSQPMSVSSLCPALTREEKKISALPQILRTYASGVHIAFSYTPQALIIRSILDPAYKRTFSTPWIEQLSFAKGDVVNGVYKVSYAGAGPKTTAHRVELVIEAPSSYKGHVPNGILVAEVEQVNDMDVVFVNETWMWRRAEEKPTLVEGGFGAWMHRLMAGWLIMKGVESVRAQYA